jgi:hypothetical protein
MNTECDMVSVGKTSQDGAATLTMWLGPSDQPTYRQLKEGLTVEDSLSGEAKRRMKDGLIVRDVIRRRGLEFDDESDRRRWLRRAVENSDPPS